MSGFQADDDFIDLAITDYKIISQPKGTDFAVYLIEIYNEPVKRRRIVASEVLPESRTIERRYSQFFCLHQTLVQRYQHVVTLPELPPREVLTSKLDTGLLEHRRHALESYLRELVLLPEICQSYELNLFLEMIDLAGKVVVVTPADYGVAKSVATVAANLRASVILGGLDKDLSATVLHIRKVSGNTNVEGLHLDMSSLESVYHFAEEIGSREDGCNILVNVELPFSALRNSFGKLGNEENLRSSVDPESVRAQHTTTDGFQLSFGANYLAHYLLTVKLLEYHRPSRIVNVVSVDYKAPSLRLDDSFLQQGSISRSLHQSSNLARLVFTMALSRKLDGVAVNAACCPSDDEDTLIDIILTLFRGPKYSAAKPALFCAIAEEMEGVTGKFFDLQCREKKGHRLMNDPATQQRLWTVSATSCSPLLRSTTNIFQRTPEVAKKRETYAGHSTTVTAREIDPKKRLSLTHMGDTFGEL